MITFKKVQTIEELIAMHRLRYEVYCKEKHYLDASDYPDGLEHDEWDNYSIQFIAKSAIGIAGTVRLIKESPLGFPIEKHFNIEKLPGHSKRVFAEGSRYIVHPRYRKSIFNVANGLNKCIIDYCRKEGITDVYIILDKRLYTAYKRIGLVLKQIGESQQCFQCINTPYVMPIAETLANLMTNKPRMYEFFSEPFDKEPNFQEVTDKNKNTVLNKLI